MKYIRTKDKIIALAYLPYDTDTIEELCDEFVCEKQLARGFKYRGAISYFRALRLTSEIFGAIWTDKGLIYVAKMNEKGELELI